MAKDNEKSDDKAEKKKFVIHVDGQNYDVIQKMLSGAQIKALAHKDAQYQLFLEEKGNKPDRLIGDTEIVEMENGLHFYTVPPASFGASWT
jgi:hypothetical protein